jgi:hypothetical protein
MPLRPYGKEIKDGPDGTENDGSAMIYFLFARKMHGDTGGVGAPSVASFTGTFTNPPPPVRACAHACVQEGGMKGRNGRKEWKEGRKDGIEGMEGRKEGI